MGSKILPRGPASPDCAHGRGILATQGSSQVGAPGGTNTAYFNAVANGRRGKCTISALNIGTGLTTDANAILEAIYDFYRDLLRTAGSRNCGLAPATWLNRHRVSEEENAMLMVTFSESELDAIIREMKSDTAPGPDGL
jgi:hypothetical protein